MIGTVGLLGTATAFVLWTGATASLVGSGPAGAETRASLPRRLLILVLCVAALVGSCWGPGVKHSTEVNLGGGPAAAPAETVTQSLRTPVLVASRTVDLSPEGAVIRDERTRRYHLPITLVGLLVWGGWWRMRRGRRPSVGPLLGWVGLLLALPACTADEAPLERADREVTSVRWDTLAILESPAEDTVLFAATRVAADRHGIRVLDAPGHRVAMLGWDGDLRWYAGRRGAGPGEFAAPREVEVGPGGTAWVLDVQNHRLTGFDREGERVGEVSLSDLGFVPHTFAVDPATGEFLVFEPDEGIRPVRVSPAGRVRRGPRVRFPGSRDAAPLALQAEVGVGPGSDVWVVALAMGDGFLRFSGLDPVGGFVPWVEPVPLVRVEVTVEGDPASGNFSRTQRTHDPVFGALGIAVAGPRLLVRFGGTTELRGRLLDAYDAREGRYLGTLVLPTAGRIAVWEDRVVLARNSPHPQVLVVRPAEWP